MSKNPENSVSQQDSPNVKYVDVIVPLPLGGTFTYSVPPQWADKIRIGMRVVVPFGKKKMYTAIVYLIHSKAPEIYEAKEIIHVLDEQPVLRHPQIKFWEWISSYYQAYLGDVYQAAVPAGLKLESETQIRINPDFEATEAMKPQEVKILDALSDGKTIRISELNKTTGIRDVMPPIKSLLELGAIEISEELTEKFRPKTEAYVRLSNSATQEDNLRKVFDELSRAKKQLEVLMKYIELSRCLTNKKREVSKKDLLEQTGASTAILSNLVEKNILELYQKETGRLDVSEIQTAEQYALNEFQQKAFSEIEKTFLEKPVVLLHGVTSSGKTEIYIHLIQKALSEGKQVLYLVPEIALTTQLTSRLKRVFGNRLGVYHSKFSDAERVEIWNNVLTDKSYDIVIGVRSSVFLPFRKLGLIIVDEEHETSYKQFDPAPRYHARNAAIVLAGMHGAKTLLGTATPAIETYFNAKTGKYGLVELKQRHEEIAMPEIITADLKEAYRKKQMESHFTPTLLKNIRKALDNHEQVILFQNRRGYAPYIECKACSYVPKCKNCDVSLTVHKSFNTLSCHYCGYTEPIPALCPVCQTPNLNTKGFGTEKIEDEIKEVFPEAHIARMDLDTTRSKKGYEKIIHDFEEHKIDILVGTQMISKGLDFGGVSLVGVLNADNLLNFPDFRAHERAFQLMAQVSGRAGRKTKQGTVILQTSSPEHPVINQVIQNDYDAMYDTQCAERQLFNYPPYCRLIQVSLRHRDAGTVKAAASQLASAMRTVFGNRVLGPNDPLIARIQNMFIKQILLKIELNASAEQAKQILRQLTNQLQTEPKFKSLWINLDIDPM
ncbi:primosomal protein N' [Paludibacter sp. 221]|uniref:replication restart helicase PriA n=1 Tax=Paludibacter sp. 221 TaxID=2302939 RepID=UPI0013D3B35A|nr:primosomal protein N' [Paludibacter sp. 221]NDV46230.1 primosomal protein N' [Paludibacter sp. 221]